MMTFHSLMDRRPHSSLRTSTASEGRTARTTRLQRDRHGSTAASLEARRSNARLHRFLAALCAGLTVFATLQCVRAAIATQPIVVAVRNVAKGTAITREDVELREAPSDGSLSNAFHTLDDAVGSTHRWASARTMCLCRAWPVRPRCAAGPYEYRSAFGKCGRRFDSRRQGDTFQRHHDRC